MTYTETLKATYEEGYHHIDWVWKSLPDEDDELGIEAEDDDEGSYMEQYSKENCQRVEKIFEDLVENLIKLGENAPKSDKENLIKSCVLTLNALNDEFEGSFIETTEREDLCELIDKIAIAAGLDPLEYEDADITCQWREW
jgi:hypothetical protein